MLGFFLRHDVELKKALEVNIEINGALMEEANLNLLSKCRRY
jgi:hypothetical protein